MSKNNPSNRRNKLGNKKTHQGKDVKPVQYIGDHGKYMAVQFDDGTLAFDQDNAPLMWKAI